MGGKGGGGGGNYYQQPADTSGYGTPEEAAATLAKEKPLDMSGYQSNVNVKRAARDATAAPPIPEVPSVGGGTDTGSQLAQAVLKPPGYWTNGTGDLQPA